MNYELPTSTKCMMCHDMVPLGVIHLCAVASVPKPQPMGGTLLHDDTRRFTKTKTKPPRPPKRVHGPDSVVVKAFVIGLLFGIMTTLIDTGVI